MKMSSLILVVAALVAGGLDNHGLSAKTNACYRETPNTSQIRKYPCPRLSGPVLQAMHASQANLAKLKAKNHRSPQFRPRPRTAR